MGDAHIAIIEHGKTTQILTIRSNTRWQICELFIHERYMDENMDIEMQARTHCTVTISYIHSFYGLMDFVFL